MKWQKGKAICMQQHNKWHKNVNSSQTATSNFHASIETDEAEFVINEKKNRRIYKRKDKAKQKN